MECDLIVNSFMETIENSFFVKTFEFLALITEPVFLAVLSLIIATALFVQHKRGKGEQAHLKAYVFAGTAIVAAILIKSLKEIIMRARPANALISEVTSSMPSGHTTFAIVFFGLLAYFFMTKKTKVTWILSSTLAVGIIAFSRLYLRVHWPTDILAGMVLGSIILTVGIFVHKRLKS